MPRLLLVVLPATLFLISACAADSSSVPGAPISTVAVSDTTEITVYKSPTCGCCNLWVDHLEQNGFTVQAVDMENVHSVKEYYGIPSELASCHTGVVGGYAIEGHVPAADILRLLEERPEAIGLSVPGMPIGSPGMEVEGRPADSYDVLLITDEGSSVFESH